MTTMPDRELARFIQHTLIQPGTSAAVITRHCEQAVRYGFDAAMVGVGVGKKGVSWSASRRWAFCSRFR